jgi:hypothetical protein
LNRINITIVLLLLFLSCCSTDKSGSDYDIESDVTISLGDKTFVSPFKMVDCAFFKDGGSIGFELEDKSGNVLKIIEYRGFGKKYKRGTVFWGTMNPVAINPSKKIIEPEKLKQIFDQARLALSMKKKQDDRFDNVEHEILYDYIKKK